MSVTLKQDNGQAIRFAKEAFEDRNKTIAQGRYIVRDVDIVYIKQIGEKDETPKVADEWINQLREQAYGSNGNPPSVPMDQFDRAVKLLENFRKGFENQPNGFPVREWAVLTPSQVANMNSMETFTVEQVAGWNENAMARFGNGGRELKAKAVLWLASGDQKAEQITALEVENKALKAQLEKLAADVAAIRSEANEDRPQRGRPRKEAEAA